MKTIIIGSMEDFQQQYKTILDTISGLTDSRNETIRALAELKMGHTALMIAVFKGERPQSDLDAARTEMSRLQWIVDNEVANHSQTTEHFHLQNQALSAKIADVANQERIVAKELKYRRQFNLVLTERTNSVRDWDILESDYQRYHFDDLNNLRDLRGNFNNVPESVRILGFLAYATANGCGPYNEDVTFENVSRPRA